MLKVIAVNVGIDVNDLSRFKGGMNCLKESDVDILSNYLYAVVIPQWNIHTRVSEKKMSARERLLASRNRAAN